MGLPVHDLCLSHAESMSGGLYIWRHIAVKILKPHWMNNVKTMPTKKMYIKTTGQINSHCSIFDNEECKSGIKKLYVYLLSLLNGSFFSMYFFFI